MIFKIDKSCLDVICLGDEDAIAVLEQLALYRRRQKNYIFAEKEVLEKLMLQKYFSKTARSVFLSLYNNSSEDKLYLKSVNKYINIVSNKINKENCIEIPVELTSISEIDICNSTVLITENQEDASFYKLIAKHYIDYKRLKGIKICFEIKPGGGDNTARVLEETVISRERLCLCIVDSDRKFPDDSGGTTKMHVENFAADKSQDIWKVRILDVHEVENLIPIEWMEKCNTENCIPLEAIDFLKHLKRKVPEEKDNAPVYYFDIKDGIKKDKFVPTDNKNERFRDYWNKYIEEYGIDLKNAKNIDCEHIIKGINKKILDKVLKEFGNKNIHIKIEDYLIDKWLSLGIDLFSWGCVGRKIN